jgi:hypothetical protein
MKRVYVDWNGKVRIHEFEAMFESSNRTFISPDEASTYMKDWHGLYDAILVEAQKS